MTQLPAQCLSPSVLPVAPPLPHRRLQLVLPETSQGSRREEPEDFAQDSRSFGATRADTLNNLSIKRKKTKHVRSSSKMSGRKIF